MAKTEFTLSELKLYFSGKRMYYFCLRARETEQDMRIHADGIYPKKLIEERRPNESIEVMEYRKKIWVAKTKPYFSKIENTLQKIRRSTDWNIQYPQVSFDKIVDGEKMEDYAEYNFPEFESITNWAFGLLLRNYLIDANGVCLVAPMSAPEKETDFVEPVVTIFNSCDVIDYVPDDYAVLANRAGCFYGDNKPGKSFYIVTTVAIHRYDQVNGRGEYSEAFYYQHDLNELPVFKLGGIVLDVYGYHSLYESRIAGILPEFNEALREYSDLQAAKVLHLYPERWEYTQNQCTKCKGIGKVQEVVSNETCNVICTTCSGSGMVAAGPYSKIVIGAVEADKHPLPTPPAGFVEKDVEIIKVQEQGIKNHIYEGLASINFEFLTESPLNQSGKAKEVDKDELNTMVHSIAEDIVKIIDRVYLFTGLYRYSAQYTPQEIYDMLPKVSVPEKYDILSTKYYDEQITSAIKNKLNPAILNAMEVAYATKAFNNNHNVAEMVSLVLSLDPLGGVSEDDKNSRLANNGITHLDYIVSSNINKFVSNAVELNKDFADLDIIKQKEIIYQMATLQVADQNKDLLPPDVTGGAA